MGPIRRHRERGNSILSLVSTGFPKQNHNLVQFINSLAAIYATDLNYAAKLQQIASMPEVRSALSMSRMPA